MTTALLKTDYQDNMKKMLEKAEKLGKRGASCSTIKSFFNAHTDEQFTNAMKQLEGKKIRGATSRVCFLSSINNIQLYLIKHNKKLFT